MFSTTINSTLVALLLLLLFVRGSLPGNDPITQRVPIAHRKLCEKGQCENQEWALGPWSSRQGAACEVSYSSHCSSRPGGPTRTSHYGPKACYLLCEAHAPHSQDILFYGGLPCTQLVLRLVECWCFSEAEREFSTLGLCGHLPWQEGRGTNIYLLPWSTVM